MKLWWGWFLNFFLCRIISLKSYIGISWISFHGSGISQLFLLPIYISIWQLSPVDLLNSRDKFRQAPPQDLPHVKHGEVEAYFAVLITLYHIRKLLLSHGIRPAYEMLEEKLRQGYIFYHTYVSVMWRISLILYP